MPTQKQQHLDSAENLNCDAHFDPRLAFTALCQKYECQFAALIRPPLRTATLKEVMAFSNWPSGLLDRGKHFALGDRTDLGVIASETIVPFRWTFKTKTGSESIQANLGFEKLSAAIGLFDGWVFPVHGPLQLYGFAMVSGLRRDLSDEEIALLHASSIKAFGSTSQAKAGRNPASNILSTLEKRTLQMLANGAGAEQAGLALGLSVRAVQAIISSAKSKLKANQAPHAIAIAVRKGIIQ